ncbi:aldo/keto reductase [Eubacteriales bacterium OttesenSCG-928-N13]|nr:aldo/keto reductase [Eubacteriales bacterium OttesenSCG-928-N13]
MAHNNLVNNPPTLGFGLMRLPEVDGSIDMQQVKTMVDDFMAAGFTYFDTAWGYMDGKSEETLRKAVVERYPRDAFTVATKLPIWLMKEKQDPEHYFTQQLERTGAGYFDYYMLHALGADRLEMLDQLDVWTFLSGVKQSGRAKHIGISFHDTAEVLDGILRAHPELDFVQLQINYADWDDEKVQSRLCYETCAKHGKAVIIMEPVKGGSLAGMSDKVQSVLKEIHPDDSIASWAMRFCGSLDNVITVLSGMSNIDQMQDNINVMKDVQPLNEQERAAIDHVRGILSGMPIIPCTSCRYCVEECPQKIQIPNILNHYNDYLLYDNLIGARRGYRLFSGNPVKASECIQCGLCETRCPQKIGIIDALQQCVKVLEV